MFLSIFNFWRGSPASRGAHLARPMPAAPRAPVASVPARYRPYDSSIDHHPALIAELRAEPAKLQAAFKAEYEAIGAVLVDRIKREEAQLYPLYQPASALA